MPFTLPYLIGITVTDSDGNAENGVSVTLKNETTTDTLTQTTNSLGKVLFDCGNFTNGYTDGDYLIYTAEGTGTNGNDLRMKIVSNYSGTAILKKFKVYYESG